MSDKGELEHANLWVANLDETAKFLTTALPHFRVRGGGESGGNRWLHVGTATTYLALNEAPAPLRSKDDRRRLNHLGFVVDDVAAIHKRLLQAGYREGFKAGPHPYRKRLYFLDSEDLEWEFVEYLSDDPKERNDYST